MRETIEDIRAKLLNETYRTKEQLRLSLVARILDKLGWDIWNPNDVYAHYCVETAQDKPVVDFALFTEPSYSSVFIIVAAPHEMMSGRSEPISKSLMSMRSTKEVSHDAMPTEELS